MCATSPHRRVGCAVNFRVSRRTRCEGVVLYSIQARKSLSFTLFPTIRSYLALPLGTEEAGSWDIANQRQWFSHTWQLSEWRLFFFYC